MRGGDAVRSSQWRSPAAGRPVARQADWPSPAPRARGYYTRAESPSWPPPEKGGEKGHMHHLISNYSTIDGLPLNCSQSIERHYVEVSRGDKVRS
ncbi:Hypothetical predicted protein [Podarcis lilfordi]|uniref:Uncharacterized protein n=1 Tax=Podarcis lilfordi TaxID=74358 RepID=A0AA35KGS9_9SAUR|nr:Hypothetical predicted protein [Podarcis lilfordi]